jgi:carbonic anhydrase
MKNLMTFPWIAEAVEAGRLSVQGFMFDIHNGVLSRVTPEGVEPVE